MWTYGPYIFLVLAVASAILLYYRLALGRATDLLPDKTSELFEEVRHHRTDWYIVVCASVLVAFLFLFLARWWPVALGFGVAANTSAAGNASPHPVWVSILAVVLLTLAGFALILLQLKERLAEPILGRLPGADDEGATDASLRPVSGPGGEQSARQLLVLLLRKVVEPLPDWYFDIFICLCIGGALFSGWYVLAIWYPGVFEANAEVEFVRYSRPKFWLAVALMSAAASVALIGLNVYVWATEDLGEGRWAKLYAVMRRGTGFIALAFGGLFISVGYVFAGWFPGFINILLPGFRNHSSFNPPANMVHICLGLGMVLAITSGLTYYEFAKAADLFPDELDDFGHEARYAGAPKWGLSLQVFASATALILAWSYADGHVGIPTPGPIATNENIPIVFDETGTVSGGGGGSPANKNHKRKTAASEVRQRASNQPPSKTEPPPIKAASAAPKVSPPPPQPAKITYGPPTQVATNSVPAVVVSGPSRNENNPPPTANLNANGGDSSNPTGPSRRDGGGGGKGTGGGTGNGTGNGQGDGVGPGPNRGSGNVLVAQEASPTPAVGPNRDLKPLPLPSVTLRPVVSGEEQVTILEPKPKPAYTDDARKRRIEGVVRLKVLFTPDGKARFVEFVQRLDPGLDDNAVQAVKQLRFKPPSKAIVAVLSVTFELGRSQ